MSHTRTPFHPITKVGAISEVASHILGLYGEFYNTNRLTESEQQAYQKLAGTGIESVNFGFDVSMNREIELREVLENDATADIKPHLERFNMADIEMIRPLLVASGIIPV